MVEKIMNQHLLTNLKQNQLMYHRQYDLHHFCSPEIYITQQIIIQRIIQWILH